MVGAGLVDRAEPWLWAGVGSARPSEEMTLSNARQSPGTWASGFLGQDSRLVQHLEKMQRCKQSIYPGIRDSGSPCVEGGEAWNLLILHVKVSSSNNINIIPILLIH